MAKDWWKTFFDQNYIDFWTAEGDIAYPRTKREVNFLEKAIPLRNRHSLELARRGYKVIGLDYSKFELNMARAEAKKRQLEVGFRQGDARNFKFKEKFDVIINMFTAFGYGSREDDKRIIHNVSRHLKKGGKFFIELMSLPWLLRHYKAKDMEQFGNMSATMQRRFDFLENVNYEKRTLRGIESEKLLGLCPRRKIRI